MLAVATVIEKLSAESISGPTQAGEVLLNVLSAGRLQSPEFLVDPLALLGPPYFAPRYLAQVTLRAFQGHYESVEDVIASLQSLEERRPPTIERARREQSERAVLPEAKVLDLRGPVKSSEGHWVATIEAFVTSGALHGREVRIDLSSRENGAACFLVPFLWIHAAFSAYNLVPVSDGVYGACPETFLVIEPMRQINATSVARSLFCPKPQLDQIRRGKGDVTIATLKGIFVHSLFDRLLEGETDVDALYDGIIPRYLFQLASVADDFFDEGAFRAEVLRHVAALQEFIAHNPHLREHTQLELKRYSATIGIQGRIDAVFRQDNRLDILELKTGARIRPEDHAQLFIYRLLLSDQVRRWQRNEGMEMEITARLLSSTDGSFAPLHIQTDFFRVLDARNKLLAFHHVLGQPEPQSIFRYEGFNTEICGKCASWERTRCKESSVLFGDRPESLVTPQLEYFNRLTRLVERERWQADQAVADLLDDSRTDARRRSFRTLTDTAIAADGPPFTFLFEENTSDIEVGDGVLIHSGNISSTASYHGYVRSIQSQRLEVFIPLKNLSTAAFEGKTWTIDKAPGDVTAEASHTALYDFLIAPADAKKRVIVDGALPSHDVDPLVTPRRQGISSNLNDSQMRAIHRSIDSEVFHLIWGPPGSGKTRVIPEIAAGVNGPILLGAFTNTAVDKMLIAMLEHNPAARFLRIGRASDSPELCSYLDDPADYFSEDLALKHRRIHVLREVMKSIPVVAATAHRAGTTPYLRTRAFEMVIVDEAGQLTEPLTLALIMRGRRFVLIGDDRQLPPVVRNRELAFSMFERLKRNANHVTLLDTQYRMHPDIMAISNKLFYEGRLRSGTGAAEREPHDGPPVEVIPVGDGEGAECASVRRNRAEAEVINRLVRRYIKEGVRAASIGVISPFRAQVVLLRQLLEDTGVTVDTVERFQGGERDVIILSFVRSQGSEFVFDARRFNVATTRARRKLVLVAHPKLFRNSQYEWISTFSGTLRTAGIN